MTYHLSRTINGSFNDAVEKVTKELKEEGFGIITTIDLKETFKKKINVNFREYLILGACNPRLAYEALQTEDKLGVFLPCNVVLQQHDNDTVEVSIINPEQLMDGIENLDIKTFEIKIKEAMQNVLNRL